MKYAEHKCKSNKLVESNQLRVQRHMLLDLLMSRTLGCYCQLAILFQGGMKAVLWTDTVQAAIMFMGILAVIIQGFITVGWDKVWKDANDSGRLDMQE